MVEWGFLFAVMEKMGFPKEFTDMLRLLFQDAAVCVKVNGSPSESFTINRGVNKGYPLAPYLFLIVAEVLNRMVTTSVFLVGYQKQVKSAY
jgi:hypothetical protein